MLIRRASLLSGAVVDIRVGERITEIGAGLVPSGEESVLDAAGGLVIPGLHDHHVHVRAAAAALDSVMAGPPQVRSRDDLAAVLSRAIPDDDGWIRAVGYHDSVAGPLTRALLDELVPVVPLRVQHRSGALWGLNTAALSRVGLAGHPDGRLFRIVATPWADRPPRLNTLSETLLGHGVTGVTDATPDQSSSDIEKLSTAVLSGEFIPRLHCLAAPGIETMAGVTLGPTKRILDDSTLDLDEVAEWIRYCHGAGRAVAVHCVTAGQLVVTLAALRSAGSRPGDRVEHAAVVPADCIDDLAELGVTVVTQPNFVAERGDEYLAEVAADEHAQLWRVRSLQDAGVPVALSTDTPFGAADPWAAMRAAVHRTTRGGVVLGADERISAREALLGFLGAPEDPSAPRSIAVGQAGDLCLLAAPADVVLAELDSALVSATVVGGELVGVRRLH